MDAQTEIGIWNHYWNRNWNRFSIIGNNTKTEIFFFFRIWNSLKPSRRWPGRWSAIGRRARRGSASRRASRLPDNKASATDKSNFRRSKRPIGKSPILKRQIMNNKMSDFKTSYSESSHFETSNYFFDIFLTVKSILWKMIFEKK